MAGRPSKYKEEYPEMLYNHMASGFSFESFGGVVRACRDTLYEWCKVHDAFSYAKKEGQLASQLCWEKLMLAGTTGDIPKFSAATAIFTMKCRFGWKDEQPIVVKKEDSKLIIDLSGGSKDDSEDSSKESG